LAFISIEVMQQKEKSEARIQFTDIFDLNDIQNLQNVFSDATGVASIITYPDGTPITRPSNFCRLCIDIIRKTDIGLSNCFKSDAEIGRPNLSGPVIKPCLSGGLWDAGASIFVGNTHIANWLIGQVRNEGLDPDKMVRYANEIGADQTDFIKALDEVPVMSKEKFEKVAQMLFVFANEISSKAYHNMQLKQSISDSEQFEEALASERNLLRNMIDNIPDRIYAKDLNSRFIICNNALVKRMGMSDVEDIIGKSDFDLVPQDLAAQYFANEQEIIKSGIPLINHEESMGIVEGKSRWNLATKVPLRNTAGNIIGIIGIGRDITDRKLAEEEINFKNELLQTINAEKDKFFSILAHDLKGPLSAFLGATQILSEEIQNMSLEEIKEISVSMKESASNIYGLLENLLEWSRLKRGMMEYNPVKLSLKERAIASTQVLNESARKKGIIIINSLSDNLEIVADSHMLETIIRNLVSNAIKFTPAGGEIKIASDFSADHSVVVKVSDSGIGIPVTMIHKLFHLNENTKRKGTEGEPSTGLGLLLCKEFIDKHGGKIWVESVVGKGSTFNFSIPKT
jgi:PAS domain S-box-containing protein